MALGADGKAQIQALDRTRPLLPMRPGQIERCTHNCERHANAWSLADKGSGSDVLRRRFSGGVLRSRSHEGKDGPPLLTSATATPTPKGTPAMLDW